MKIYQLAKRSFVVLTLTLATSLALVSPAAAAPPNGFKFLLKYYHAPSGLTVADGQWRNLKVVKIEGIDRDSPAFRAGLEVDDYVTVIKDDNGQNRTTKNRDSFKNAMDDAHGHTKMLIIDHQTNTLKRADVELPARRRLGDNFPWPIPGNGNGNPPENEPDPEPPLDLNGVWHSTLGTTTLTRNNDSISGMIDYPLAGSAQISGTVNGNSLTYTWVSQNPNGAGQGQLTIAADGRSIRGLWVNVLDNTGGEWVLWR